MPKCKESISKKKLIDSGMEPMFSCHNCEIGNVHQFLTILSERENICQCKEYAFRL